jgi:hypothetical protein
MNQGHMRARLCWVFIVTWFPAYDNNFRGDKKALLTLRVILYNAAHHELPNSIREPPKANHLKSVLFGSLESRD